MTHFATLECKQRTKESFIHPKNPKNPVWIDANSPIMLITQKLEEFSTIALDLTLIFINRIEFNKS